MDTNHALVVLAQHVRHLIANHPFWNHDVSRETSLTELDKLIADLVGAGQDVATVVDDVKTVLGGGK